MKPSGNQDFGKRRKNLMSTILIKLNINQDSNMLFVFTDLCGELEAGVTFNFAHFEAATGSPVGAPLYASDRIFQVFAELFQNVNVEGATGRVTSSIVCYSSHVVSA